MAPPLKIDSYVVYHKTIYGLKIPSIKWRFFSIYTHKKESLLSGPLYKNSRIKN